MADPMTIVAVVGTVLSVGGQVMGAMQAQAQGEAQAKAQEYRAAAEKRQAGEEAAASQQRARETARRAAYVLSAERAGAAASGGGASDPSIVTNEGNILARGDYGVQSDLYVGKARGAGLETQAGLDLFQADQARDAGQAKMIGGLATALGSAARGGSSLYDKYGPMSPLDSNVSSDLYQSNLTSRYGSAYRAGI